MSNIFTSLLMVVFLISCYKDDKTGNQEPNNPLTESLVELGVKYGSEDRQFLDLYKAESDCPTPIYFDAHGNNGIIIVNKYQDLGIGDKATLVHSIGQTNNTDKYQFLVDFALSVIETCP